MDFGNFIFCFGQFMSVSCQVEGKKEACLFKKQTSCRGWFKARLFHHVLYPFLNIADGIRRGNFTL